MKLAIADTKYITGIGSLEEAPTAQSLQFLDLDEALKMKWASDAHFVAYTTKGPRYRKAIAEQVIVTTKLLCFDCDNPEHARWDNAESVLAWFAKATELVPFFYAIYTTRSGGRIILKLIKYIDVREAQEIHKLMSIDLIKQGLNVDDSCSDWTRMFRLPYVVRDDEPTWNSDLIDLVIQEDMIYEPRMKPMFNKSKAAPAAVRKHYNNPQPTPEIRDLIWS